MGNTARSDAVKKGIERAPHRSLLRAVGCSDEDLKHPFVGVVSSYSEVVPGHQHLDKIARAVITRSGYGDYFIHAIGHHIGLETHDVTPDQPLKAGSVFTIEPGIYIPDEAIGVRIEDDILVTKDGYRNLSARIPKTTAAIEKIIAGK